MQISEYILEPTPDYVTVRVNRNEKNKIETKKNNNEKKNNIILEN